jgi:integrase
MTLGLNPVPQILPALLIERNSVPVVIPAPTIQASIPAFTQSGTGMVRMWPPLPTRSAYYATLAILLGCGLRRAELTALRVEDIQQRKEHRVITTLQPRSTCVWLRSGGWPMRLLIAVCSVLTWLLGIRRVKGAKRLGVPVGNWLTAGQGKRLLLTANGASLRGKRVPLFEGDSVPRDHSLVEGEPRF